MRKHKYWLNFFFWVYISASNAKPNVYLQKLLVLIRLALLLKYKWPSKQNVSTIARSHSTKQNVSIIARTHGIGICSSTVPFLPISRGRISAAFPIKNSHLFSQNHVWFSQLRKVKKKTFFFFTFFRDHYYLWKTLTHIRVILKH